MMIRIAVFFFLILTSVSCRKDTKQEYQKFQFDFSAEWTYRYYFQNTGSVAYTVLDTLHFWFDGDTVLNRYTRYSENSVSATSEQFVYHRLMYKSKLYFNPDLGNSPTETVGVKAYIREDTSTNKYYITYTDTSSGQGWEKLADNEEALLFDFNLEVNDSLDWCRWYVITEGYDWNAVDKKVIHVGNYKFDKINLYQNGDYRTSILVGIGATNRFDRERDGDLIHFHCADFDYYP